MFYDHKISSEEIIYIRESELKEIIDGNSFRYSLMMVIIFYICVVASIVLALSASLLLSSML